MSIKRTIIVAAAIVASVAMVAPMLASATTVSDLMAQIAGLQAQLQGLSGTTVTVSGACAGVTFTRNLTVGSVGADVKCMQTILNRNLTTQVAVIGAGSPGLETTYFGAKTLTAVRKYQVTKGFTPANQVGPMTRRALGDDMGVTTGTVTTYPAGCTSSTGFSSTTGASCATGVIITPVVGGGLSVAVAYDTPAASSVAAAANANFTKVTLTAGSAAVNISNIYVTRSGLSANSDLQNIMVVDASTGIYFGNVGSINSDNRALITFTQPLVIAAGTSRSFYLRAGFVTGTTAGKTALLSIASASDIVSNASAVTGTFPATGNTMTCVSLTIGSLTAAEDGTTVDSKPNVGDKQVILNNFKLSAGSTEDVTVQTISMLKAGTVNNNSLTNFTLYDVTKGTIVGQPTGLTAEGKAAWSGLNLVIQKGNTERFQIKADIVDGPSLTANADIIDGSNVLVTVIGNNYGFYITPTVGSWNGSNNGQGAASQTIQAGASTISRAVDSPATGNVSAGSDIPFTTFSVYVTGEAVRISSLKLTETGTGTAGTNYSLGGTNSGYEGWRSVTNVKVYDSNGVIVAGPKDLTGSAGAKDGTVTFSDVFVIPTGTHEYTIKGQISSNVLNTDTIVVGIADAATDVVATGMTDNSTVTFAPTSAVNGNTQTIKAAALVAATNTAAARNIAVGTKQVIFGTAALDATNSGENVNVTTIAVTDTASPTTTLTDLQNMTLWADLTSGTSARGDIYETQISNPVNESAAITSFSLTKTISVPKGSFIPVALIADLSTGATAGAGRTHTVIVGTSATGVGLVANGASTGSSITVTKSGSGVAMTNASTGSLTATVDSGSNIVSDILLGGQTATLGAFRLTESGNVENVQVNDITFNVTTGGTAVSSYAFYNGNTLLGVASSGTAPKLVLNAGQLIVPQNASTIVTVKGVMNPVDGTTVTNGTAVTVGITAQINGVGMSSGSAVTTTPTIYANQMTLEKARPTFALSTSPANPTTMYSATNTQLAIFDVSNTNGGDDVVFDDSVAAGDQLVFNISKSLTTSNATARTWSLTDGGGTTYATATVTDSTSTTVTFNNFGQSGNTALKISPNVPKKLYVIGDTTEYVKTASVTDSIQLSLPATAANCTYTVGTGTSTQAMGAIVFRGTIYGNAIQHQ